MVSVGWVSPEPLASAMSPRVQKRVGDYMETPLVAGRQVDAVLTPTPRREVELSAEGNADEIRANPRVREVYLGSGATTGGH